MPVSQPAAHHRAPAAARHGAGGDRHAVVTHPGRASGRHARLTGTDAYTSTVHRPAALVSSCYPFAPGCGISGLPGLKCFRITSGSLELKFVISTPAAAICALTKNSSSVISPNRMREGDEILCLPNRP